MPCSDTQARRHRDDGQPPRPQGCRCARGDRSSRCNAALPSQIFSGPQSDRAGVQQTQGASTKSSRANHSTSLAQDRRSDGCVHPARMRQLLQACRICFYMTGIRSSSLRKNLEIEVFLSLEGHCFWCVRSFEALFGGLNSRLPTPQSVWECGSGCRRSD